MRLFVHTKKAVRAGHPADRLFLVVDHVGSDLLAWKCTITPNGIQHPAFTELLAIQDLDRGAIKQGPAPASMPTAMFKRDDSFYKEITLIQLANRKCAATA